MSGTSLDGIDGAMLKTDGQKIDAIGICDYLPFDDEIRARIKACFGATSRTKLCLEVEQEITLLHVKLVQRMLANAPQKAELIGFHGQTISHDPRRRFTLQLGDGKLLADQCKLPVVYDFRSEDVRQGGQGAPLVPIYHQALRHSFLKEADPNSSFGFLNLGGVSNLSLTDGINLIAGDCGACNAPINDWVSSHRPDLNFDQDGKFAAQGQCNQALVNTWLEHDYFKQPFPKSLDRNQFESLFTLGLKGISLQDGCATLCEFAAQSIASAIRVNQKSLANPLLAIYLCGGGRKNLTLIKRLQEILTIPIKDIHHLGLNGDCLEAEAFGFLAVRSLYNLPNSFPMTTGAPYPIIGGVLSA